MFEFIERLRQKPYHTRVTLSIVSAAGITAVIFLIWLVSFSASLDGTSMTTIEDATPLEQLGQKLSEGAELSKNIMESWRAFESSATSTAASSSAPHATSREEIALPATEETGPPELLLPAEDQKKDDISTTETPSSTTPASRFEDGIEVLEL